MIVHIGYHKTGTTFLQRSVFPLLKGIRYVDYYKSLEALKPVYHSTTLEYRDLDMAGLATGDDVLYSLERLVGDMGIGDYNYEIACRLKELGCKKVIITIRRQHKMVGSIYRQYVQQGGVRTAMKYVDDPDYFRWSYLDYEKLINHYADLFGLENVLVLPQEEIFTKPGISDRKLMVFCGAVAVEAGERGSHNRSLSYRSIQLLRIINHFTYNRYRRSQLLSKRISTWFFRDLLQSWLDPKVIRRVTTDKTFFDAAFQRRVVARYAAGNARLAAKFKLDLEGYGYFRL